MKKIVIVLSIIISILCLNKPKVPEESIRFRIIANSNSNIDQKTKKEILNDISKDLINNKISTISGERKYLIEKIPTFKEKIEKKEQNYTINYGKNYFPEKEYKGETYKAGKYESLVITLGDGKGDNFWCVLFPPLCMIEEEDIEYKSIIKEVLKKYF